MPKVMGAEQTTRLAFPKLKTTEDGRRTMLRTPFQNYVAAAVLRTRDPNAEFGQHDDFLDACSRVYDMNPRPPEIFNEADCYPEIFADGV
jgi:hypothetical protein